MNWIINILSGYTFLVGSAIIVFGAIGWVLTIMLIGPWLVKKQRVRLANRLKLAMPFVVMGGIALCAVSFAFLEWRNARRARGKEIARFDEIMAGISNNMVALTSRPPIAQVTGQIAEGTPPVVKTTGDIASMVTQSAVASPTLTVMATTYTTNVTNVITISRTNYVTNTVAISLNDYRTNRIEVPYPIIELKTNAIALPSARVSEPAVSAFSGSNLATGGTVFQISLSNVQNIGAKETKEIVRETNAPVMLTNPPALTTPVPALPPPAVEWVPPIQLRAPKSSGLRNPVTIEQSVVFTSNKVVTAQVTLDVPDIPDWLEDGMKEPRLASLSTSLGFYLRNIVMEHQNTFDRLDYTKSEEVRVIEQIFLSRLIERWWSLETFNARVVEVKIIS